MSNRLFQGIVHQLTDSIDRTIGVIDESGTIISCSELGKIGEVLSTEVTAVFSGTEVISVDGYSYKPFGARMHPEYAVCFRRRRPCLEISLNACRNTLKH